MRPARPAHATVVAYLALFIALGGTSFAAVQLGRNAVKAQNVAPNAISSSKVKDRTLLARDFKRDQLPRGLDGLAGPAGPAGANGAAGPAGAKGDTGAKGDKGDKGDRGEAGAAGTNGTNGTNATINGVAAGGALAGTYPDPTLAAGAAGPDAIGTLPFGRMVAPSPQTLPNGTLTGLAFGTSDVQGGVTFGAGGLTVPRAGTYVVTARTIYAPNATGLRSISVAANGVSINLSDVRIANGAGATTIAQVAALRRLAQGDVLTMSALQSSGGNLDTFAVGGEAASVEVAWVGP